MPSTAINYFSYLPQSQTLRVKFQSGLLYDYKGVPEKIYKKMKASGSKGKFLNEKIKGIYPFEKVSNEI